MSSPQSISIVNHPTDKVILFGKEFTADELKEAVIDSAMYRQHLKRLMEAEQ